MSTTEYTKEPDMSYWDIYKSECKAENMKPSFKDYLVWLDEMEADKKDFYEGGDV